MQTKIADLKAKLRDGVSPAMATPLLADGYTVNTAVIPQLVNFLLGAGVKGLFVGGTTGEGILLDGAERMKLHKATIEVVNGRVPVLIHAGTNRTDTTLALVRHAAQIGADAVAVVPPIYYGMHDDSLFDYYQTIAEAVPDSPLFLYDIPHMAINGISPSLLRRLSESVPSLAGVKTSRRNAEEVRQVIDAAPDYLIILAGSERIALGSLAMGAAGLITGLSTAVPEIFVNLTAAFAQGDTAKARHYHQLLNEMLDLLPNGARIGAIKQILTERGIDVGTAVPPRPTPSNLHLWSQIQAILSK
jgi:dihydrodipicolinate synthase/N-acetylneuraminate lyase